jgi:hypothetical protein
MRINYNRLFELNKEAIVEQTGDTMTSFWIIQSGVEKFIHGETLTEEHKNLLLELGVLELNQEESARQTIVGPFKFSDNGSQETN